MTSFTIIVPDWFLIFACIAIGINTGLAIAQAYLTRKLRILTEENNRVEKFFKDNKQ